MSEHVPVTTVTDQQVREAAQRAWELNHQWQQLQLTLLSMAYADKSGLAKTHRYPDQRMSPTYTNASALVEIFVPLPIPAEIYGQLTLHRQPLNLFAITDPAMVFTP